MLATVTQKMTTKSTKFEIVKASPPLCVSMSPCERISIKMHRTERTFLLQGDQIYCLQACTCALCSPEILQDEAVKGLRGQRFKCTKTCTHTDIPHPTHACLHLYLRAMELKKLSVKRAKFLRKIRKNREEA